MDEVSREIELDSDPEVAWEAISEGSELSDWLGDDVEIDLSPGGEIRVGDGDSRRSGFVESVEDGRGLSFWWAEDGSESTRVELEVIARPAQEGCVVRVTESRPLAGLERELAEMTALARL